MAYIKGVSTDNAFRIVEALASQGGVGRFQDIERLTGTSTSVTASYTRDAIERGWVNKTGPARSIKSRYTLTHDGRAEYRKRRPSSTITVDLGSGPVGLMSSDLDIQTIASQDVATDAGATSLRQRIIKALCEEREWATLMGLLQAVRTDHRDRLTPRDVGAVLNSLNQQGLVTFVESGHENGHHSLTKIKATRRLLDQERVDTTTREIKPQGLKRRGDEVPQRAGDRTDFRTHEARAVGGPIERTHTTPAPVAPAKEDTTETLPEPVDVTPEPEPEPTGAPFPITRGLLARRSQMEMAARLLEDAGQDDLALSVLAKIDDYTAIEREAMEMFALLRKEA